MSPPPETVPATESVEDAPEATAPAAEAPEETPATEAVEETEAPEEEEEEEEEAKSSNSSKPSGGSSNKPAAEEGITATATVSAENNVVTEGASFGKDGVSATVSAGTLLDNDTTSLTLTVKEKKSSDSGVKAEAGQTLQPLEVHIDGVSAENTQPITVCLGKILPGGMNIGNVALYHVENGTANAMTQVMTAAELDAHNEFYYDPATGNTTVAMASFSEVAVVSEEAKWKGNIAEAFNGGDGSENDPWIIANADQLAYMSKIVSENEDYADDYYKLVSNVNLSGDTAQANDDKDLIFYPIGYWAEQEGSNGYDAVWYGAGNSFTGVFDGNGNTISNIYQNTWLMDGNYDAGYWRTAMGLFGALYNATIKNLTVDNFQSDGEFTPTGCIAAYAGGPDMLFENIQLTNCNPRVYNTGNGGLVGLNYNSSSEGSYDNIIFRNVTVDQSNTISALWGSYDVSCGGILGRLRENSKHDGTNTDGQKNTVTFENCHVAAIMDVNNDVCANYQYYQYRYSGMFIGTVDYIGDVPAVGLEDVVFATNSTYTYGDWNEYWYCELVKNSLASYTHDHQFSRLTKIADVSEIKDESGNWNKEGSFVVPNADNTAAECYHIFKDSAGNLYQHLHDVADESNPDIYETKDIDGNGELDDLKEDRYCYFIPFGQLWTGYGWGSSPSYDAEAYENIDITLREDGLVQSVEKFKVKADAVTEVTTGGTVTLGALFELNNIEESMLSKSTLAVFVSPVITDTTTSTVSAEISVNTGSWGDSTLTFSGTGDAKIVITDYFYCTETVLNITVKDQEPEVKFATKFTGDFLYRVGNANTVALGSLFEESATVTDVSVKVTCKVIDGNVTMATPAYNTTAWESGTLDFDGTGVVKLTITDDDYCEDTELYLEVVDAKNATTATSATSSNVVLLNDISISSLSVSGGHTFYGNGFTVTLPTSSVTNTGNGFLGHVNLNNGHLDNVKIVGPVYPEQYIYREQAKITDTSDSDYGDGFNMRYFHNSVIINAGDCKITNSYISGSRAAIYIKDGGDVLIENTTVSGGSYANIQVAVADSVTFKDLTTVQTELEDSYNAGKKIIGLGVVIDNAETDIYIEGTLNQHNWITQTQWESLLGSYKSQFPALFTDTAYQSYWHYREGDSTTKYVNLTMIFACDWDSSKLHDNHTNDSVTYTTANVTVATANGGVYSTTNLGTLTDALFVAPVYASNATYAVPPKPEFDYTNKNYVAVTEGSNEFCYEDNGIVKISFDKGNSKDWDTSILTVTKGEKTLPYTVTMDGTDYTDTSITFTVSGNYVVTYTYTDPYNYTLGTNSDIVTYSKEYTETVNITVTAVEAEAKNATFTMGSNSQAVDKITIDNNVYLSASGLDNSSWTSGTGLKFPQSDGDSSTISFKYSGTTNGSWGSATINGQTFYFPVVAMGTTDSKWAHTSSWYGCFPVFDGAITITDYADGGTGTEVTYNSSTTTMPTNLSALYPQTVFRYQGTQSKVPTTPSTMTKGTYKGELCYTTQTDLSASNERSEEWNLATYTYTDNKGTTYYWYVAYYCAASTDGTCVTGDTLITLADGSQVRVDTLTGNEELLVWNHSTGTLDAVPVAYIVDHNEEIYEQELHHLYFSDGSDLKIIGEHVFYDATLNKYVTLDENAADYIGHTFVGLSNNNDALKSIQLVDVVTEYEETGIYEVVSYEHLTCFTNGILSASAYMDKLLNIFDIDTETLAYDPDKVQSDIETYGLYTYDDFEGLIEEAAFELYNAQYLKIAVGKGYITWDDILDLIDVYFNVGVTPLQ